MDKSTILLSGLSVYLKILSKKDVSQKYLNWLNDKEINQFLEIRHSLPSTTEELSSFVIKMFNDPEQFLFGIFLKSNSSHIGNIKLGDITSKYSRGDIGLFIGDKASWGKGIGAEVIGLVTTFAFNDLCLNKVSAGAYANNKASIKAFVKNNYVIEGILEKHYRLDSNEWIDGILMGKCRVFHEK